MFEPELPRCFGPYLRYAIAANFVNFNLPDDPTFRLLLLIKFKNPQKLAKFLKEMEGHHPTPIEVQLGPGHDRALHVAVRAEKAAIGSDTFDTWNDTVDNAELSLPLLPSELHPSFLKEMPIDRWNLDGEPAAEVLLGVIDDGCPFAAAQFLNRSPGSAASTRVRAIWDQNQPRDLIHITDSGQQHTFGQTLPDFQYGAEFWRRSYTSSSGPQIGLNEWIARHAMRDGSVDEDGCYADAKFRTLKRRASHGAHMMDVLAGRLPPSSRVGAPPDYRDPPSFLPSKDTACTTDLVFVQFPEKGVRDATGVWLKAYVIHAINYILSFAHPQRTKSVIVNLSYGPTTGPHDGTAELEQALSELVQIYDGHHGVPRLEIFLPDGNAYLSEGHVAHQREPTGPDNVSWTWRIPPDNTVLCFAEVWMNTGDVQPTTNVTLISPNGTSFSSFAGQKAPKVGAPVPPYTGVFRRRQWGSDTMWLLAVEPTIAMGGIIPEHGDWTIRVDNLKPRASLHAYVARSDPNMGVRSGARRSYFVDRNWECRFGGSAGCTYVDGKFDRSGSLIKRLGTLNGIATDNVPSIHVAGGFVLRNGRKAPYASAGPSRKFNGRLGPDYALFCDETPALRGARAGGNRSGSTFRLIGTSTAAPQLARWATRLLVPAPGKPGNVEERGAGNIPPP